MAFLPRTVGQENEAEGECFSALDLKGGARSVIPVTYTCIQDPSNISMSFPMKGVAFGQSLFIT